MTISQNVHQRDAQNKKKNYINRTAEKGGLPRAEDQDKDRGWRVVVDIKLYGKKDHKEWFDVPDIHDYIAAKEKTCQQLYFYHEI